MVKRKKIVIILGPTATGKTKFAVKLAKIFNAEIVSADSRQVYKQMDLGTGKDLEEYQNIPYHLIDIKSPKQQFSLAEFQAKAYRTINKIHHLGKLPLLVGGTGLYLQAIIEGWLLPAVKPDYSLRIALEKNSLSQLQALAKKNKLNLNQSDWRNKRRLIRYLEITAINQNIDFKKQPKYDCLILGLSLPKEQLDKKINARLKTRLKQGLVGEVSKLHKLLSWQKLESFGLEYKWISLYLQNKINYQEMVINLQTAIHRYAKRQMTWLRRMERQGIKIHWNPTLTASKKLIKQFID